MYKRIAKQKLSLFLFCINSYVFFSVNSDHSYRSSRPKVSYRLTALKNFAKLIGKEVQWSLDLSKVAVMVLQLN